jgi:3-phenylpropionate/trans-cinnamate dioxygenase ferredoxin reductase subunit
MFLAGALSCEDLHLQPAAFYRDERIELRTSAAVRSIDRHRRLASVSDGSVVSYDALVLATGSRPRRLALRGSTLAGVHELRTVEDAERLRPSLQPGTRLLIVGGGYIGLEVAAIARSMGVAVVLLEAASHILARVTGPAIAEFLAQAHREAGVDLRLQAQLESFEGDRILSAARLRSGERIECDLALVGVGAIANQELAEHAGLACENGIRVDNQARTSDSAIYAIGDCAERPIHCLARAVRLESVHNAVESGKLAAASILGVTPAAQEIPWFWSEQYDLRLQSAGIYSPSDLPVVRLGARERTLSVFYLRDDAIVGVDAISSPAEFLMGRKLIGARARIAPRSLADASLSMKEMAALLGSAT